LLERASPPPTARKLRPEEAAPPAERLRLEKEEPSALRPGDGVS